MIEKLLWGLYILGGLLTATLQWDLPDDPHRIVRGIDMFGQLVAGVLLWVPYWVVWFVGGLV